MLRRTTGDEHLRFAGECTLAGPVATNLIRSAGGAAVPTVFGVGEEIALRNAISTTAGLSLSTDVAPFPTIVWIFLVAQCRIYT